MEHTRGASTVDIPVYIMEYDGLIVSQEQLDRIKQIALRSAERSTQAQVVEPAAIVTAWEQGRPVAPSTTNDDQVK